MRKKILKYKAEIDEMLKNPPKDIDYAEEERKHLIQIQFLCMKDWYMRSLWYYLHLAQFWYL